MVHKIVNLEVLPTLQNAVVFFFFTFSCYCVLFNLLKMSQVVMNVVALTRKYLIVHVLPTLILNQHLTIFWQRNVWRDVRDYHWVFGRPLFLNLLEVWSHSAGDKLIWTTLLERRRGVYVGSFTSILQLENSVVSFIFGCRQLRQNFIWNEWRLVVESK